MERMNALSDERELEDAPMASVYYSAIIFTGHNEFRPQTNAARLLIFSLTLWALITGAAYTANLASFLVARQIPLSKIHSIDEAVSLQAPICLQGSVALDNYVTIKHPNAVLYLGTRRFFGCG
jgi:hypothetical protein